MGEKVVSMRVEKETLKYATEIAREEHIPKSAALRKLLALGVEYSRKLKAIRLYREGKVSLGKAAEIAGVCMSEMMDVLSRFGVKVNITFTDYKKGLENIRKVVK